MMGVNHDDVRPRGAHRHLQRVVHHQLPGADGEGAPRRVRHRQGPDDDHPRLHRRPEPPGQHPQGPRAAPAPPRSTSCRPRPAPPRRSAWCCPSSRASSTATRCGCRCRPARPPTSPSRPAARPRSRRSTRRSKAAADGRYLRYSDRPDRLHRHRHRPGVVHLRRAADQGDRQPGEGRRLVRQRVGLLQPPRRPDHLRRRDPLTGWASTPASATSRASGSSSAPTSTCRSTAPTITDDGRIRASVPTHQGAGRRRRPRRRGRPPGPAEGRAGPGVLARAGGRPARRAARRRRRLRHRHRR